MRILSIETSGRSASVALLEGKDGGVRSVGETLLAGSQRTAQVLAPAMRDLLAGAEWSAASLELVAVVVGPGSFTGLRIGVTTAKTLAYAVGAAVVAVNTLDVLAAQAPADGAPLWAVVDAQRQELFAARFGLVGSGQPEPTRRTHIVSARDWLAGLAPGERVIGPALQRLESQLPSGVVAVAEPLWQPTASVAGRIAWAAYQAGQRDDVWTLVPQYYRPSAAEEKAAKREEGRGRGEGGS
jgi:tRNA threonylcarbamoyladenosine biosynthesis protein TsaB